MRMDARVKELHDKYVAPLRAAAQRIFSSEDGKKVLEAIERVFVDEMIVKDHSGRVDENAVLVNVGALQVISYLRSLAEPKEGQGP